MYLRWQGRKRQTPCFGSWAGEAQDEHGEPLRNRRWNLIRLREASDGTLKQDIHWTAILCENVRINGRPTRRHIACLGSITESGIDIPTQVVWFWGRITEVLGRLGNRISAEDRKRIEAAIAVKVPKVSEELFNEKLA